MAFFSNRNSGNPALYLAEKLPGDTGWCAYVLPPGSSADSELDLTTSFNDLPGTYLFSCTDIAVSGDKLVESVRNYLAQKISPNRAILWINQAPETAELEFKGLGFSLQPIRNPPPPIFSVTNALVGWASDILELSIPNNCEVSLDAASAAIRIDGNTASSGPITFNTIDGIAQTEIDPNRAQIFFSGPGRGCIIFELSIRQGTDFDIFDFGLKYFIPAQQGNTRIQRYPLLRVDVPTQNARVGFRTWLDLTNIQNDSGSLRTFFAFTGKNKNGSPTVLPSTYTTAFGHAINLAPKAELGPLSQLPGAGSALMLFQTNPRLGQNRYLAPAGDFALTLADGAAQGQVLCGVNGTESIAFTSGDLLQFSAAHEAYAPVFPFPLASPVGPPVDPAASLLSSRFTTSWATIVKAESSSLDPTYVAQPKGSALFGRDALINDGFPDLFGHRDPAYVVPQQAGFSFPMAPYSAVVIKNDGTTFTREELESFELQVLGPTRRGRIGDSRPQMRASAVFHDGDLPGAPENVTTPSGVVATIDTSPPGAWTRILLGQVTNGALQQISFENPDPQLVQLFQTGQAFLVAANACHLGKLASGGVAPPCPVDESRSFQNQVEIGGWKLAAKVGQNSRYADYRDVLIFKGTGGKIYDPPADTVEDTVSLVANPSKWTQRGDFSSPTVRTGDTGTPLQPPDENQQVILSQWLQDYFRDVRVRAADPQQKQYFQKLDQIARDENWTGFLILKMTIQDLPKDLAGIAAGITNKEAFNAHHFAIEISQVLNQPGKPIQLDDSSSMFGLIYYSDPDFTLPPPEQPPAPVPPATGVDYDFRLLTLRVLFENTAVKSFQSYVQVTLNKLFGMPVDHMGSGGNAFNSIVLSGSYQNNNGRPVYSLGTTSDSTYYFNSNVIQKLELTSALMSTRNPGNQPTNPTVISWIGFTGFIDFKIVRSPQNENGNQASSAEAFDILSFGNDEGQDLVRKGLSFSNLGLKMSFPVSSPLDRELDFSAGEISFDLATSTPRGGSLFSGFSLQIQALQQGSKDSPPSRSGYATVITEARLDGVDGGDWWGIRYQLNMGTPGNLAGNLGLNSFLLTAWAPESSGEDGYKAVVGLQLPGTGGGAKLISLQNVLRLSIGQMRLVQDRSNPEDPIKPFLLMLTEIALKFLGLLKIPPSGSTLFYLFGNPKSRGKPSGLGWYAMYNQNPQK